MLKFVFQFFSTCLVFSLFIPLFSFLFYHLEQIGVFPDSKFFETGQVLLYDYVSAFLVSLVLNFGFCGLRFFEISLKLQDELAESRFQILQAQINPHFMFNVLNHVNILIRKEPDLASSVLVQYTNILRYQLYNGKKEYVSIKQEVDFLKDFIEVEKIRWKNNLDVKCSWNVEDDNINISPLLLITFVENAFKHVFRSKTEKGYVHIDLIQKNGELEFSVENSKYPEGVLFNKEEVSGIGLENIKKRLDILYPKKYHLHISETDTIYSTILSIKL